jgi:hypothetical protein
MFFAAQTATLASVRLLELELSTVILYDGQPLIGELIEWVYGEGFELIALQQAFRDPGNGDLLQVNGLFRRAHE